MRGKLSGFWVLAMSAPLLAQQATQYELSFPNAVHHEAEVRVIFRGVADPVLHIVMSRSSPGRYALHEFAKNIYHVHAFDGAGKPLQPARESPSAWVVSGHDGVVRFEYTLFGDQDDGTYAAIDLTHAHLNLPAALAWAPGYEHSPSIIKFDLPEGLHWAVSTQLKQEGKDVWSAPNLESLMDGPVEISAHDMQEWKVEDAAFRLAIHHRGTAAQAQVFADMCKAVVLEEEGVFGALPKYDNGTYTFLIDYLPYASFDGMEHRDSAVITAKAALKNDASREIGTVSHEFFHSWNVKRIRPKSLEPFDFEKANMCGELWFAEGFTSYYAPLVLKRAGLSSMDDFLHDVSGSVNEVLTAPGRNVHTVIGMSDLAPFVDAARSIDPTNFANTFISYYTSGEALAFGLDLAIRGQFPGKSLDDWMRTMWREHPDIDKPYTLDDLEHGLQEATGSAEFAEKIFRDHIRGKAPLDYAALVSKAGLLLRPAHPKHVWLGARLEYASNEVQIATEPLVDSPLYKAGLEKGDKILDLDGHAIRSDAEMGVWLAREQPGDLVQAKAETRTGIASTGMILTQDPAVEIVSFEKAGQALTPEITAFRAAWLGSKALHPLPQISPMP
ncbi:MAG: M61 family metallopeptidase [Acidobacteriaceae bacterium]|nr:M61 family metallopeptidase [Acidobacteriaceae bacterium]